MIVIMCFCWELFTNMCDNEFGNTIDICLNLFVTSTAVFFGFALKLDFLSLDIAAPLTDNDFCVNSILGVPPPPIHTN